MENQWQPVGIHVNEPSKFSALAKVYKSCQLVKALNEAETRGVRGNTLGLN